MTEPSDVLDLLQIGLPIEVQVPMPDSEQTNVYFSQIIDRDQARLHISAPQRSGQQIDILLDGEPIFLRFSHAGIAYTCACRKLGWHHDPEGMLISHPYQVERIQRRNFVRVRAELPVTLTLLDARIPDPVIRTRTTDLSGGGMMIVYDRDVPLYIDAQVQLTLPPESDSRGTVFDTLSLSAQICRSIACAEGFQIGLCFLNVAEKTQDRLVRFIFRHQREQIKDARHLTG
ncbi:MAG: hypothetical protein CVV27_18520 [Candidatus Melainabacteria bacterium HGW-Melainabacteria-1]|nr:MAG: hypothetical protein CVV27_18520 [Candidatus Melainabacteria bacterium HGW-Melainabacteria-1]